MQSAKEFSVHSPSVPLNRVQMASAAAAARRAKRLDALENIAPELDRLARVAKAGGLGLIGYFLDMALYEATREREQMKAKP